MATYKVLQDIEAEDKLLGPLTLRQFIYAGIVIVLGFICFKLIVGGVWFFAALFLPIMIFFGVLAAPFGHEQSSEVWLLAKIRFFLKPRRRIWDQSGMKELVTITVPKHIEKYLTKDFSQTEVRSRLHALANTIDSRGWAVKNPSINLFNEASYAFADQGSDRLLDPGSLPQDVPSYDVQPADDMFDEQTSPTAQHLSQLMASSTQAYKKQVITQMKTPPPIKDQKQKDDYWFLNGPAAPQQNAVPPGYSAFTDSKVIVPGQASTDDSAVTSTATPSEEEKALLEKVHAEKGKPSPAYGHMKTIQPLSGKHKGQLLTTTHPPKKTGDKSPKEKVNPAIIDLANNDDLNVSTIARQANKATRKKPPDDEVVVSLR